MLLDHDEASWFWLKKYQTELGLFWTEGFKQFSLQQSNFECACEGWRWCFGCHHPSFPELDVIQEAQAWRKVLVDLLGISEENTRKARGPGCFHPSETSRRILIPSQFTCDVSESDTIFHRVRNRLSWGKFLIFRILTASRAAISLQNLFLLAR